MEGIINATESLYWDGICLSYLLAYSAKENLSMYLLLTSDIYSPCFN